MFFIREKLIDRTNELGEVRYQNKQTIDTWLIKEDTTKEEKYPPKVDESWKKFQKGDILIGRDKYFWIQTTFKVPFFEENEKGFLMFDLGYVDEGTIDGLEALFFLNGKPHQGVDTNHPEVLLTEDMSGEEITISLKLWTGLEAFEIGKKISHEFKEASFMTLNTAIDELYYTAKMINELLEIKDKNDSTVVHLEKVLDESLKKIQWSYIHEDLNLFNKSCIEANDYLQEQIDETEKNTDVTIHAVGHTHIDVAWLWRYKHTREKIIRSFTTVFRLMEQYPEYIFLQSQPQLYEYIKEDYPELYPEIQKLVAEGRWEVEGGMWLEADTNIPSGESLVRQIFYGKKFMKDEFGVESSVLWLPDVFGYSWALPQILKLSNIDTLMTTKISWNQYNRMPHDTFYWRGLDGTDILTHFITAPEPADYYKDESSYTYNGFLSPKTVVGSYENYADKRLNSDLLLAYGHGDGGGGVSREMLKQGAILDKLPGIPHVKPTTIKDYFAQLHETVDNTDEYVHTWDGELYLELHRGTYTTQSEVKRRNRRLEYSLRWTEYLMALEYLKTGERNEEHEEIVEHVWKTVLRHQFHDVIPGTSIKEVYEDVHLEYDEVENLLDKVQDTIISNHQNMESNMWTIWNDEVWARESLVHIESSDDDLTFFDEFGDMLASSKDGDGYIVATGEIPQLGTSTIYSKKSEKIESENTVEKLQKNKVETSYYVLEWTENGGLTSVFDKTQGIEVLEEGQVGNQLVLYEDKPLNYEAWDIDIFYGEKYRVLEANSVEIIENNDVRSVIQFNYEIEKTTVQQKMILYPVSPRIDFVTDVDWQQRQELLKVVFPLNIRTTEATYDCQFGNIKRPTNWNNSWNMAQFEAVGHEWIDLSEYNNGVSLLSDSKYGFSAKDNVVTLSLLRSAMNPDLEADRGKHQFTYSLYPHSGGPIEANVVKQAREINNMLAVTPGTNELSKESLIRFSEDEKIDIASFKLLDNGESGLVLRIHDYSGGKQVLKPQVQFEYDSWQEVNLLEEPISEPSTEEVVLEVGPYEVKTICFNNPRL